MATSTSGTGLKKETAAALVTLLGPTIIVPVLFILIEKDEYVRFWAFQSIVTSVVLFGSVWVIGLLAFTIILAPLVALLNGVLMLLGFILWLVYIYKAWQGEKWIAPIVGKFAMSLMKKA